MNFKNKNITIGLDEEKGFKSFTSQDDSMIGLRTVLFITEAKIIFRKEIIVKPSH